MFSRIVHRFSPNSSSEADSPVESHGPSESDVRNHLSLLIGQAILLVLLALVHIGYEAYTVNLEADVSTPKSIIREETSRTIVEIPRKKALVLGTDTDSGTGETSKEEDKTETLPKDEYFIAITGDSMVETMGRDLPALQEALKEKYPETTFYLYNYGQGARNVSGNLRDFHEPQSYKDRNFASIDVLKPDIIIVGSSAYNLYDPHDVNKHWLEYTRLVQEALTVSPNVYMLAEPAPRRSGFAFGVDGIVWEPATAWVHTDRIIKQLNNVLGLSETLGIPVIDTFTPSLEESATVQGRRELIDTTDNIHLSEKGKEFVSEIIVDTIDFRRVR